MTRRRRAWRPDWSALPLAVALSVAASALWIVGRLLEAAWPAREPVARTEHPRAQLRREETFRWN